MARVFKSRFKVESDEVQGPGSWVEFQRPTWGMIREITETGAKKDLLLELSIADWNWTDDNGDPLPLPKDKPGLVEQLPQPEAQWLLDNSGIVQKEEAKKN